MLTNLQTAEVVWLLSSSWLSWCDTVHPIVLSPKEGKQRYDRTDIIYIKMIMFNPKHKLML